MARRHLTFSLRSFEIIVLVTLLILLVLCVCLLAAVPPVSRDALIHHLAIPKLYLEKGGMYEIPGLYFSYYPMNLDLLYLIPLYFKNDILPKFIHFAFALITAAMIYRYLARRINMHYAMLGSLFFLSIPVVVRLSSIVYVDLGLVCFLFAALLYLFKWIEENFRLKYLLISAAFCGLALGTKYNGLVGLFLFGLFVAFVYARYHSGDNSYGAKAIGYSTLYVLVALIIFSPWMIRNSVWTGNPVYPLYNSIFKDGVVSAVTSGKDQRESSPDMSHIQIRRNLYNESGWEIALIPLRVFFQGKDNDPKYFDGKANPFLLLLPIFAFLGYKKEKRQLKSEKMLMLFFSICFLFFACAQTSIRIRYFSPIIPPLVVLSMFGLHNLSSLFSRPPLKTSQGIKNLGIFSIIFVMLGLNIIYMADRFQYIRPISYLSGKISRDQYVQQYWPEYASMKYANQHLSQESKILGVYIGNRGYYSDIPIAFSLDILQKLASKSDSAEKIAEKLLEKDFTHLIVNYELFNFWVKNYSRHEKKLLQKFFESFAFTKFSKDGYGLLQIMQEAESG